MVDLKNIAVLSARVAAIKQAMDAVMQGSTPDHAKWQSVNTFVSNYNAVAKMYVATTGDNTVNLYDMSKLKNPGDVVWPAQKANFDAIYVDILVLANLMSLENHNSIGAIYNLLVSGREDAWSGEPFQMEVSRCIREYTDNSLTLKFGQLDTSAVNALKKAPCIFAYEKGLQINPKFGYLVDIIHRQGEVRLLYNLHDISPFLKFETLEEMRFELDIDKMELYRTHWAVKQVNLPKELHSKGITLPNALREVGNAVDVSSHEFDVALSFPGEVRPLVERIAEELERGLGPNSYFYDSNYTSQLAQPSLDVLLQGIYRRSKLIVVFLSSDYQRKEWCGVEFRAIREIIKKRDNARVMFVRTDDGPVEGVFETDGYVDAKRFNAAQIAGFVAERLALAAKLNAGN